MGAGPNDWRPRALGPPRECFDAANLGAEIVAIEKPGKPNGVLDVLAREPERVEAELVLADGERFALLGVFIAESCIDEPRGLFF